MLPEGEARLAGLLSVSRRPALRQGDHPSLVVGPVVKDGRVEIGTVRPHERVSFAVDGNRVEPVEVPQRAIEFALQYRLKVDRPAQAISKPHSETVWADDLDGRDFVDRMLHLHCLLSKRFDFTRQPASLYPTPGSEQF